MNRIAIDHKTDIMVPLDVFDLFTGKFYVLFNKPVSCPPPQEINATLSTMPIKYFTFTMIYF